MIQMAQRMAASFTESFLLLLNSPRSMASASRTTALNAIHGTSGEWIISAPTGQTLSALHRIAYVEQYLEIELLSAVGKIERCHLGLVAGDLGALEGLAIHLIEVGKYPVAGT